MTYNRQHDVTSGVQVTHLTRQSRQGPPFISPPWLLNIHTYIQREGRRPFRRRERARSDFKKRFDRHQTTCHDHISTIYREHHVLSPSRSLRQNSNGGQKLSAPLRTKKDLSNQATRLHIIYIYIKTIKWCFNLYTNTTLAITYTHYIQCGGGFRRWPDTILFATTSRCYF